ncbi:MAG: hypothetical protein KDA51_18940, partial [Planctomycetales bacterium]|nr:hypothetical protein [Planctomycetales bacterium]
MALSIGYTGHRFTGALAHHNKQHNLTTNWGQLVWSAITVGRPSLAEVVRFGPFSLFEIIYRSFMLFANLQQSGSRLIKSDAYKSLDPSEKGAVSYFVGQTMTKLLSADLFDVDWLLHLDVYGRGLPRRLRRGKKRPDLIGLNRALDWLVVESKGHSNPATKALAERAKFQALHLRTIDGSYPFLRLGAATYFSRSGFLRTILVDPYDIPEDAEDLDLEVEEFFRAYYRLLLHRLTESPGIAVWRNPIAGREYRFAWLHAANMGFGLDAEIAERVESETNLSDGVIRLPARRDVELN